MQIPDGFSFGFLDNGILILSAYFGVTVEYRLHRLTHEYQKLRKLRDFLKQNSRGAVGGVVGAGLGHTVSNGVGALLDPSMNEMVIGIIIGTTIPVVFIPLIEKLRNRK